VILAITKNNEKLIYDVCKKNNLGLPQIITGIESLYRFAVQDLKSLSNYNAIIIDINSTKEKEDDIVRAVVAIKSMYNVRVIVLALGYKEGNSLLARLFNEGIYNFVNGKDYETQVQQFKQCLLDDGNFYKDAIRFRGELSNYGKDTVVIKREYKTLKQYVSIGIAGTETHIGVTTQCLLIVQFLNSLGMKACYICGRDEIENLEVDKKRVVKKTDNLLVYSGIDLYSKNSSIEAMNYGYDFYIYDLGVLNDTNMDNFTSKDIKILVGGLKYWEMPNTIPLLTKFEDSKDLHHIFNFCTADIKREWKDYYNNTYFAEYTPDPFAFDVNTEIYHSIFKDYIAEKSSKLVVVEKKKGLFNKLRRQKWNESLNSWKII